MTQTTRWLIEALLQASALGLSIWLGGLLLEAKYAPLFATLGAP